MNKSVKLSLPRLTPLQEEIKNDPHRFKVVSIGRRAGKSLTAGNLIIESLLRGDPSCYICPTFPDLMTFYRYLIKKLPEEIITQNNQSLHYLELITGGSVEFFSLTDPESARGRRFKLAIIDEAAKASKLEEAWTGAILPTLADLHGTAFFLSTPKGMNYFNTLYKMEDSNTEWKSFQASSYSNPHIPGEEFDALKQLMPEIMYEQEILSKFIESHSGIFRFSQNDLDSIGVITLANGALYRPCNLDEYIVKTDYHNPLTGKSDKTTVTKNHSKVFMGIDLAKTQDFTVLTAFNSEGVQIYYDRFNSVSFEIQCERIVEASKFLGNPKIYLDSTGKGDPILDRLISLGLNPEGYLFTNTSKQRLIDNLSIKLEKKELVLMEIPDQTGELLAYEYTPLPSGKLRAESSRGHDDIVCSLMLAVWGLFNRGKQYSSNFFTEV